MARLRPLDVRRRSRLDDSDDYLPPLGTARAQREARRDYDRLSSELLAEDDDRPSHSYKRPME